MHIAFAVFKVFPHGGVARDLRKFAAACLARGHEVRVYAMVWHGAPLPGAEVVLLPRRGLRSHVRQRRFAGSVATHLGANPVDLLVGMNKMPGLDIYYAGDSCFEDKARNQRPWFYRLTPRYHHYARFEQAVFGGAADTRILAISTLQTALYRAIYGTPAHRFHALPPGIERDRAAPSAALRATTRAALGIGEHDQVLLFLGSGFVKKGLDRVLRGMAALPGQSAAKRHLLVVGDDKPGRFERLAKRLDIAGQVRFLGGRDDVPALLAAADASVLPAYDENTGTVILESAIAGVPVLTTANCGYAAYIERAVAGIVTPMPFEQARFNADLARLLDSAGAAEREAWSRNGRRLGEDPSLYAMVPRVADLLERFARGDESRLVVFHAFHYAPGDPRHRDLVPAALACREQGMAVRVYACTWQGDVPPEIDLVHVPVAAMSMPAREARFRRWTDAAMRDTRAACAIGFDAAGMVVETSPATELLTGVPPGTAAQPVAPRMERIALRARFAFAADDVVFVMFGGDLVEQGIERLFVAVGKLPDELRRRCRILALGHLPPGFGAALRVFGLGGQAHIAEDGLFWRDAIEAGDVFVALPYAISSNGWVFDAMAAGRTVLTHASVTEAALVAEAGGGIVLATPFRQADCDRAAAELASDGARRQGWQHNAVTYALAPARYGRAAELARRIGSLCESDGDPSARQAGRHRAPLPA